MTAPQPPIVRRRSLRALAVPAALAAAPALAQEVPVTETRCEYRLVKPGAEPEPVAAPDLHVLAQTAAQGRFTPDLPAGADVVCVRSSIVPAPGDWKVIDAGYPLYIVEATAGGGHDRIGALEVSGGAFRYRMIRGALDEDEQKLVDRRISAFQVTLQ